MLKSFFIPVVTGSILFTSNYTNYTTYTLSIGHSFINFVFNQLYNLSTIMNSKLGSFAWMIFILNASQSNSGYGRPSCLCCSPVQRQPRELRLAQLMRSTFYRILLLNLDLLLDGALSRTTWLYSATRMLLMVIIICKTRSLQFLSIYLSYHSKRALHSNGDISGVYSTLR